MKTDETLLAEYAASFGIDNFTVKELIDAHKRIRSLYKEDREEHKKELERFQEFGRKQGYESVVNGEYIALDVLKAMSLKEFAALIGRN